MYLKILSPNGAQLVFECESVRTSPSEAKYLDIVVTKRDGGLTYLRLADVGDLGTSLEAIARGTYAGVYLMNDDGKTVDRLADVYAIEEGPSPLPLS